MKLDEIKIGETYLATINNKIVKIRIDNIYFNFYGHWQIDITNLSSNRKLSYVSEKLIGRIHAKDNV